MVAARSFASIAYMLAAITFRWRANSNSDIARRRSRFAAGDFDVRLASRLRRRQVERAREVAERPAASRRHGLVARLHACVIAGTTPLAVRPLQIGGNSFSGAPSRSSCRAISADTCWSPLAPGKWP